MICQLLTLPSVPIYDGHPGSASPFTFTEENFRNLSGMALYGGGKKEVPLNSVVAVGYTLSSYETGNLGTCLLTNVQFVILLGLAAAGVT